VVFLEWLESKGYKICKSNLSLNNALKWGYRGRKFIKWICKDKNLPHGFLNDKSIEIVIKKDFIELIKLIHSKINIWDSPESKNNFYSSKTINSAIYYNSKKMVRWLLEHSYKCDGISYLIALGIDELRYSRSNQHATCSCLKKNKVLRAALARQKKIY
jgi:hypothetical protein